MTTLNTISVTPEGIKAPQLYALLGLTLLLRLVVTVRETVTVVKYYPSESNIVLSEVSLLQACTGTQQRSGHNMFSEKNASY